MLGRNLRQLARLTTATIPFKSVKPIKDAGQLCLIVVPFKGITWPVVHSSTLKKEHENSNNAETMAEADNYKTASSIYDFTVKDNSGNDVKLDKYKGHVVLIVNIASQCGLTKNNYKKITELKEKYYDKGLRVLSFPCNQFGSQMPEANGEEMVCHLRDAKADVGDVFQKIDVNGSGASPLYKYLKHKQGGTLGDAIKWNFTKFLVDKDGQPVKRYAPTTDPMDLAKDIEKYL